MDKILKKRTIIISVVTIMICILLFILSFIIVSNKGCSIDIKEDFANKHPLLLKQTSNEFILPFNGTKLTFSSGAQLRLSCPGGNNHLQVSSVKEVLVTCVSNTTFTVHDNKTGDITFKQLECVNYPEPTARRTGKKCSVEFTEIEIGFNTDTGFVHLMMICFDETKKDTIYSTYQLSSNINNKQNSQRPNDFRTGDFYKNLKPSTIYKRKSQVKRFEEILSSHKLAEKYISLTNDFFLSRGHLTARSDFFYGSQQRATFFYVNVAPQWQTFNGKNWNDLEINCRNFASKRHLDLIVYSGVFGNAQLPDEAGKLHDLSLYADINKNNLLTVPEIFWKLLHDPISKSGTVFIGHNNPYVKTVKKLCTDVCNKINWLSWKAENITLGYSYCCEYEEIKRVIDYLPDIPIHSLLV